MGMRVSAATLAELVTPAVSGLYAMIGELVPDARSEPEVFGFEAESPDDPAMDLRDLLNELLFTFEHERRMVVPPFDVEFSENHLRFEAPTRLVDPNASAFHREVKAVTYHELGIRRLADGYEATIIVDI